VLSLTAAVQLAFAASLGVLCSVIFKSTGRSITLAIALLLALTILPMYFGDSAHGDLSPIQTWRTLLRPSAAQYPESAAAEVLSVLAAYAALSGLLLAFAVGWFDRKGT
jgi:hypothetical protein